MKLFELTITRDGFTIRREAEEHLSAEQKFVIILALIGAAAIIGLFTLLVIS